MSIKQILFINFGGLGDEILFLPSIQSVKRKYPDCEITLALEKRGSGISNLTNTINQTIFANIKGKYKYFELLKLLFHIWKNRYSVVVSSGSNPLITFFLFMTFIPKKYGYDTGILSRLLLTKAIPLNKNQYAVNMYHDLVKPITGDMPNLPEFNITSREKISNSVLVHPGVSKLSVEKGMIKTITPEKWAEVVEALADSGKKVMLIGGNDDKDCIETIVRRVPHEKFENLYGSTNNLKELAELISSAEKFICSDSAPLHIASSLGTKTYAIFGSTDDKKLIPSNGNVVPIKADCDCPLQPCLWEKRQTTCKELKCLNISTKEIINTVLNK